MAKKRNKEKKSSDTIEEETTLKGDKKRAKEEKKELKVRSKITDANFKQLRSCLQHILTKINSLMLPLLKNCRSDKAAMFLSCLATDISVGLGSWVETEADNKEENTEERIIAEQLEVMKENKRWQQCQFIYTRAQESSMSLQLSTIMNAMLRPEDKVMINKRVEQKRCGMFATKESKEEFMAGHFGRGIVLIAISLIKQSWWLVLKANCERIEKEKARRNSYVEAMENERQRQEHEKLLAAKGNFLA